MATVALKRVTKAQMAKIKKDLIKQEGGVCPLCNCNLLALPPRDIVVDHCHDTGVIRNVLCRPCNGAEGKIKNAIRRWGKTKDVVAYLKRLLAYYESEPTRYIYPTHKNEEEKRIARNLKARKTYKAKKLAEYKEKQNGRNA